VEIKPRSPPTQFIICAIGPSSYIDSITGWQIRVNISKKETGNVSHASALFVSPQTSVRLHGLIMLMGCPVQYVRLSILYLSSHFLRPSLNDQVSAVATRYVSGSAAPAVAITKAQRCFFSADASAPSFC
jgi:hypothetical protein